MIAVGSDHAAFSFKTEIVAYLKEKGYEVKDFGSDGMQKSEYPEYARRVCRSIKARECDKGLLFCGTGIGMSIAANKFKGIRAAACMESLGAELSRRHNDANVLCLGARMIGIEQAKRTVEVWLATEFEGGRHQSRVDMISQFEESD